MKKRKTVDDLIGGMDKPPKQNPVAKFAGRFNKAKVFDDKSKYSRKTKHAKQEASPSIQGSADGEVSCLLSSQYAVF